MAIKVKVGVELDSKNLTTSLNSTLKSLESKKIKLNFDTSSLKQLQTTVNQLAKSMSGLKMPGMNTSGATNSVNQALSGIKQQNAELKNQAQIYSQLKNSQNEEFKIRRQLISATGEHKTMLEGQLTSVKEQQSEYRRQANEIKDIGNNSQKLLQIDQQRVQKIRDLSSAQEKYTTSMNKVKQDAINNLDTKGLSTKQIDDYKSKIESINTVNMGQVKSEIASVNKELENGRKSAQEMAEGMKRSGEAMSSAGGAILKAFAIPAAGIGLGVKAFADFSYEMDRVQAVSGATSSEMEKLTNLAKQMGLETMYSAKESAQALTYMGGKTA